MAQQQWEFDRPSGVCAVTGQAIEEGEAFYTVLFEDGEGFRRADFSLEGWPGPPEGNFCFFKSQAPIKEKRKKLLVDDELLTAFFLRLAQETELVRVQFRFVLGLILLRKRKLRYDGTSVENGVETWAMTLLSDRTTHKVTNPRLTDDEIDGVSRELTAILHGDIGELVSRMDESLADNAQPEAESADPC